MERLLRWFISPANSGPVLALLIAAYYGGVAFTNPELGPTEDRELLLMAACISSVFILIGWWSASASDQVDAIPRSHQQIHRITAGLFMLFVAVTTLTAPNIPLLSALSGGSVQDTAVARENFLKAREGLFAILPYLNGMLTFSFVPYAMCLAFVAKHKRSWWLLALFLGYSMLFVEKAFFIRVLAPMSALLVVMNVRRLRISWMIGFALAILALNIQLSGFADDERDIAQFFIYRLLQVPAQTAIDSFTYWRETWQGEHLMGATNLVFSNLFFLDRINLEREVFEFEYGAFETGTGSANSVFFVDAYVNFGMFGVVAISLLVGAVLKWIGRSSDPAMRCMAPLMLYSVFFGSFLSVMFGNGLLLFLMIKPMFVNIRLSDWLNWRQKTLAPADLTLPAAGPDQPDLIQKPV